MNRFVFLVLLIAGCGETARHTPDVVVEGSFVREAWPLASDRLELLVEMPLSFRAEELGPHRALVAVGEDGTQTTLLDSTFERSLLDVARHPSGERSAIFARCRISPAPIAPSRLRVQASPLNRRSGR